MVATERKNTSPLLGSIVLAACALPGVMLGTAARAEDAPTEGVIAFKYSGYQDSQTGHYGGMTNSNSGGAQSENGRATAMKQGWATVSSASGGGGIGGLFGGGSGNEISRIAVKSPSMYALVPINSHWAVEGTLTLDDISGASPKYYSDMRTAAQMVDHRKAGDAKLSYYAGRQTYALGASKSTESDFFSNALSAEARFASEDQNTTWNIGLGVTQDRIDPTTHIVRNQTRHTNEFQLGITQALSAQDLLQVTATLSRASGYMNDPYKLADARPNERNASIVQFRMNHWLDGAALKTGYRYYQDSYGILAHTFDLGLAIPMGSHWVATPALRYYTQSAARFYVDPPANSYPGPTGNPTYFSADQRLASFGAVTTGMKLAWEVAPKWTVDGKMEWYRQRSNWRLASQGSPGINPFNAIIWQMGLSHNF